MLINWQVNQEDLNNFKKEKRERISFVLIKFWKSCNNNYQMYRYNLYRALFNALQVCMMFKT